MRSYYDVISAVCFLLLSASAAYLSYGYLQRLSEETVLFAGIPLSDQNYRLIKGDGGCVGNLQYSIEDNSSSRAIRLIGRVNLGKSRQESSQISFAFEFRFNPLGQLTDTEGRIVSASFDRYFSSVNTNPILITVADYSRPEHSLEEKNAEHEQKIHFRSSLPGPLKISATNGRGYAVQIEALRRIEQSYVDLLRDSLLSQLRLNFEQSALPCQEPDPLDIEAVKNGLFAAMDFLLDDNIEN